MENVYGYFGPRADAASVRPIDAMYAWLAPAIAGISAFTCFCASRPSLISSATETNLRPSAETPPTRTAEHENMRVTKIRRITTPGAPARPESLRACAAAGGRWPQ